MLLKQWARNQVASRRSLWGNDQNIWRSSITLYVLYVCGWKGVQVKLVRNVTAVGLESLYFDPAEMARTLTGIHNIFPGAAQSTS